MIRAKDILEEYETSFRSSWHMRNEVVVFCNPTSKELHNLGERIRLIADPETRKVYVWDARLTSHDEVNKQIGFGSDWIKKMCLQGEGIKSGSFYRVVGSDTLFFYHGSDPDKTFIKGFLRQDWSWLKKYNLDPDYFLKKIEAW